MLLYGRLRVNVERVLDQLLGHTSYVWWFSCEDVLVGPKEDVQPCFDLGILGGVTLLQLDGLHADIIGGLHL